MKLLVLSDSHLRKVFSLENVVLENISNSDHIIHCGDFTSLEFYNFLNSTNKLIAVCGNNDLQLSDVLPSDKIFSFAGYKIALTHGHLCNVETIHLKYSDADIIIHGHTHHPLIEDTGRQLILNPGSLTWNRFTDRNSFMTLNINEGKKPLPEIHYLTRGA